MNSASKMKILSFAGLARRAGKTVLGTDLVLSAIQAEKAFLVLVASDASERTKKQLCDKCISHNVKLVLIPATRDEMAKAAGKNAPVAAIAVTDKNFAKGFSNLLQAE